MVQATVDATKAYADSVAEANKITAERERQSKLQLVGAAPAHHWAAVVRMAGASNSLTEEERAQVAAHISAMSTPEQITEIIYPSTPHGRFRYVVSGVHFGTKAILSAPFVDAAVLGICQRSTKLCRSVWSASMFGRDEGPDVW